jgi:hypothetical protein
MTAVPAAAPKILVAVGAPDGMGGAEAEQCFAEGRLHGVSGIVNALLPYLAQLGHPFELAMFGGQTRQIDADLARRLSAQMGVEVLVNAICEPGLQRDALAQLTSWELATQLPVVNPTWAVNATTRPLAARRLAHQAGVRAPHCSLYAGGAVTLAEHVAARGHRYPVLLRPPGKHGSVGLVRADDANELAAHAAALPACTVTDFVDFRSADGLWRKFRMVYAGDRLFRRHVLTDRAWNITRAAREFMRERPELVAEEQEWIRRPVTLDDGSIEARVMHQFRALQLDFGVIDFALPPDGDLVVFEINACVQLTNRVDAQAAGDRRYFEANNDEILDALRQEICARAAAP